MGSERVKEIESSEPASTQACELYPAKGYPQAWIKKPLSSIAVRGELTGEWNARTGLAVLNISSSLLR